ncbi:MAG: rhodanese-like domain-containing protein [Planctomycetota bacterium]
MDIAALVVAVVALLVALKAASKKGGGDTLEEARRETRRVAENLAEEVREELATTRKLIAAVAEGAVLDREQILEGRLWRDAQTPEAIELAKQDGVHVLDVRTPGETARGIIPGAQLIPVDQLEGRIAEVPRDKRAMLVYCAGGGRSAAACEFLSREGFSGLVNLAGGMGSWNGPVERPQG